MAKRTHYEVKPSKGGNGWDTTRNGRKVDHHETKAPAVKEVTKDARKEGNSQVIIKKENGRIQEERTYDNDPHPPKG